MKFNVSAKRPIVWNTRFDLDNSRAQPTWGSVGNQACAGTAGKHSKLLITLVLIAAAVFVAVVVMSIR